jgi:hypothetical protein
LGCGGGVGLRIPLSGDNKSGTVFGLVIDLIADFGLIFDADNPNPI